MRDITQQLKIVNIFISIYEAFCVIIKYSKYPYNYYIKCLDSKFDSSATSANLFIISSKYHC